MGAAKSKIDERKEAERRNLAAKLKKQIEIESNATDYEKKWNDQEQYGDIYVLLRDTSKTEYKIDFDFDDAGPLAPEPIGQLTEFEPKGTTESTVKVSHRYTWPSPTGVLAPLSRIWKVTRFDATVSFPDKLRSNSSKTGDYANHESAILPGLGSTYTLERAFAKGDAARILERISWKKLTKRIVDKLNASKFDFQRHKDKKPQITRFQLWQKTLTPEQSAFFATPESTAAVMVTYIKELFSAAVRLTLKKRLGTK